MGSRGKKKLIRNLVDGEKILITIAPTAGFTVGFNLTFSGSVYIDFKDGDGKEALTSGVEKTHLYAIAGTYIAEISGDLENITKFIADNNRITSISNLKTGLLEDLRVNNNLITGTLNLVNAPVQKRFECQENSGLTGITFASFGNQKLTYIRVFNCNLTGALNLSTVPIGDPSSSSLYAYNIAPSV